MTIQLSVSLLEVYFQAELLVETAEQAEWTLQTWLHSPYHSLLWQSFVYLILSNFRLSKDVEVIATQWIDELREDDQQSHCLRLMAAAMVSEWGKNYAEAVILSQSCLSADLPPHSFLSIQFHLSLGELYFEKLSQPHQAEKYLLTARDALCAYFPSSIQCIYCLFNLAVMYSDLEMREKSQECYEIGCELCGKYFRGSMQQVCCFSKLGNLYFNRKNVKNAIQNYEKACELCKISFPNDLKYADILLKLGLIYKGNHRKNEAEECLMQALAVCLANGDEFNAAKISEIVSNCF